MRLLTQASCFTAMMILAAGLLAATAVAAGDAEAAGLRTVPGESKRHGEGKVYRYKIKVERGINTDRRKFARQVKRILFHRRGWTRSRRVAFRWVERRPNTLIILARPSKVDRLCHPLRTRGQVSCQIGTKLVLNVRRWRRGVAHWPGNLRAYRRMLVNHEMGHRIGLGHRNCAGSGRKAPVMQQQTYSLQGCRAGWWPKKRELRLARRANR